VVEGDPLAITFHLLDYDAKRYHYVMEMRHAEQGYLAATSEQLGMHIDLAARRSAPMPPEILTRFERLMRAHAALPRPETVGRGIGIRR
jgi:acyl-CoA thioester hydrolase